MIVNICIDIRSAMWTPRTKFLFLQYCYQTILLSLIVDFISNHCSRTCATVLRISHLEGLWKVDILIIRKSMNISSREVHYFVKLPFRSFIGKGVLKICSKICWIFSEHIFLWASLEDCFCHYLIKLLVFGLQHC